MTSHNIDQEDLPYVSETKKTLSSCVSYRNFLLKKHLDILVINNLKECFHYYSPDLRTELAHAIVKNGDLVLCNTCDGEYDENDETIDSLSEMIQSVDYITRFVVSSTKHVDENITLNCMFPTTKVQKEIAIDHSHTVSLILEYLQKCNTISPNIVLYNYVTCNGIELRLLKENGEHQEQTFNIKCIEYEIQKSLRNKTTRYIPLIVDLIIIGGSRIYVSCIDDCNVKRYVIDE